MLTPSCQAACSGRHPAYSGSISSGVQGGEPGFHSSLTGDPAWSIPSCRLGAAITRPLAIEWDVTRLDRSTRPI